jgi:hypothetical protein
MAIVETNLGQSSSVRASKLRRALTAVFKNLKPFTEVNQVHKIIVEVGCLG